MEKLLEGATVEWKKLGEATQLKRGKRLIKNQLNESAKYAVFQNSMTPLGYYHEHNVKADTTFIISAGAAGEIGYSKDDFWAADDVYYFLTPDNMESKFLYYFLLTQKYKILAQVRTASIPRLSRIVVEKIEIPIPPLEMQREIVRILDNFTELTAELTAELSARRKQYSYYRDRLLSFGEDEVEWKKLGEVAAFRRGTAITKKQTTEGDIPVVANGPLPTYYHGESNREGEIIVIARSGAYAGYVSFWNKPIFLTDAFSVHPDIDMLVPRFVYYFLRAKQDHIHGMKKGAGVPHVRVKEFELYKIPIPPIEKQKEIVAILDKFDTLTNSISEGLPKEIELRQKQYEYYRDLLLDFPKEESCA